MPALLLLAPIIAAVAYARPESEWDSNQTSHFTIRHERQAFSLGDHNLLERIYSSLSPELRGIAPWMDQEKVAVYLYEDHDRYLQGRFKPPAWSGGLFSLGGGERALALIEPVDTAVAAHELTHLYLHSYFGEDAARLPAWLDEGLASMLENEALALPDPRDKGPVLAAVLPFERFLEARPRQDSPGAWVSAWYRQAASVARFLKRGHIEAKFPEFCAALKEGKDLPAALSRVYGYDDLAAFEAAWDRWRPRKPIGQPVGLDDR